MNRFVIAVVVFAAAALVGAAAAFAAPFISSTTFVTANRTEKLTITLPSSGFITSIISATVGGGDVYIINIEYDGPNGIVHCFITATGSQNPAPVEFVVNTGTGPLNYTGTLTVNSTVNGAPNVMLLTPVTTEGQTAIVTSQPVIVSGRVFPFDGVNQDYEICFVNAAQNTVIPIAGTPNLAQNSFDFAGPLGLNVGLNGAFVYVRDRLCPTCNGTLFAFGVDFAPVGVNRTLLPNYIGQREVYHNEFCRRTKEVFGGRVAASAGCPPEPLDGGQFRVGSDTDRDDGENFSGGGPCGSYWHLELITLPGRGLPIADGISYNSNLTLGPSGHILGIAPWSTWWTQRVFPGPASGITRFDGKQSRTDVWTDRGDGLYTTPEVPGALRIEADGTMWLRMRGGLITYYKSFADPVAPGAIYRVDDPHANDLLFEYESTPDLQGRLTRITDTYGAVALTYHYLPSGLLEKFSDLTGREVVFAFSPGPSPSEKLIGVRSPVGPEFPAGRRFAFDYVPGTVLLNRVVYPNEIEAGLDEARVEFVYDASGCVIAEKLGGTNASGIAAGGWITTVRGTRDGHGFTTITDRRGNVTEYDLDANGRFVKKTELTSGIRTNGPFITTWSYTDDGYRDLKTLPEGNSVLTTYRTSPNPFQRGDVLEVRRFAGPRGAEQAEIAVRYEYEALFNKVSKVEDPRFVDPTFVPPLGSKAHMVTRTVYEYQEGAGVPARETGWGITAAELVLNEPDRNGNGLGASGCSTVQAVFHPSTTLPGGTVQTRTSLFGHNAYGQLVFTLDPGGVRTEHAYHPESDVDGSGAYPVPGSDPVKGGFLKSVTRDTATSIYGAPEPITTKVTHSRIGDVVRTVDGRGIATTYVPNEVHLVREIIAASDTSEQPGQRNETEAVPALSIRTIFTRDANDNVVKVEVDNRDNNTSHDGAFIERRVVLDILDMPLSTVREITETETVETTLRYDANQNLISTDDNQVPHTHTRTTYDERDIVFESFRGQGAEEAKHTTEVDLNGNVTAVIAPVDRISQAGGTADGQLDRVTSVYDGHDRIRQVIDALGNAKVITRDPVGRITVAEAYGHPAGDTAAARTLLSAGSTTHDEAGRVVKTKRVLFVDSATAAALSTPAVLDTDDDVDTGNVTVTAIHDVNDRRTAVRVANRAKGVEETVVAFDGHGHAKSQTDAEGNLAEMFFDNNHQVVRLVETDVQPEGEIAAETFESSMVRDALGRVIKSKDPKNAVRRFEWGTLYMKRVKDALDNITRTRRDGLGRVIRTKRELTTTGLGGAPLDTSNPDNPDGIITTISGFDDAANQTRLEDDRGNETRYDHDSRGNVETTTYADGTAVHATYDLGDAAIGVTDQAGNAFTNAFDPLQRLVQTDIARAAGFVGTTQIVREFDGLSRLTYTRDNGGDGDLGFVSELQMRYDSLGNVLEEVHNGRVLGRAFKGLSDPVAMIYPDGTRLDYQTDRLSRLTELERDGESTATWRYIGQRTRRRAWGNGTTTNFNYDNNRRLKRVTHQRGSETFLDCEIGYNAEDCLTYEIRHNQGGEGLQVDLDSAYRVRTYRDGVANPAGPPGVGTTREEMFTLDGAGNWNSYAEGVNGGSPTTVTTAINEMNEYTQFGADPQTHNDNGDRTLDGRHRYEWDALGRLRVVKDKVTGEVIARYSYHADGRRTRTDLGPGNGNRTLFVWDGQRMVAEVRPNGHVAARTVFGRGWEPVAYESGGHTFFYHRDAKGWIAAISKQNGKLKERYRYSAYGKAEVLDNAFQPVTGESATPWLWQFAYRDGETTHYYVINRFYDSAAGRWLSRDPNRSSTNLYETCASNALSNSDLDGLEIVYEATNEAGTYTVLNVEGDSRNALGLWVPASNIFSFRTGGYLSGEEAIRYVRQLQDTYGYSDEAYSIGEPDPNQDQGSVSITGVGLAALEAGGAIALAVPCPPAAVVLAASSIGHFSAAIGGPDFWLDGAQDAFGETGGSVVREGVPLLVGLGGAAAARSAANSAMNSVDDLARAVGSVDPLLGIRIADVTSHAPLGGLHSSASYIDDLARNFDAAKSLADPIQISYKTINGQIVAHVTGGQHRLLAMMRKLGENATLGDIPQETLKIVPPSSFFDRWALVAPRMGDHFRYLFR